MKKKLTLKHADAEIEIEIPEENLLYAIKPKELTGVENEEELKGHISRVYQMSYVHYMLGKKHALTKNFPDLGCGVGSGNMVHSLGLMGYPNAVWGAQYMFDHIYVMMPFVLDDLKGVIVADPTSDQLWKKRNPRNAVFVGFGEKFEYPNDAWKPGQDLFATRIFYLDHGRRGLEIKTMWWGNEFLEKAYQNPIELKLGILNYPF